MSEQWLKYIYLFLLLQYTLSQARLVTLNEYICLRFAVCSLHTQFAVCSLPSLQKQNLSWLPLAVPFLRAAFPTIGFEYPLLWQSCYLLHLPGQHGLHAGHGVQHQAGQGDHGPHQDEPRVVTSKSIKHES